MNKPPTFSYQSPRRAVQRWIFWAVASCLFVFLAIGLLIDLNGNLVLTPTGPLPGLLNPAPALLMLTPLVAGGIIAFMHATHYESGRKVWFGIVLLFLILFVATLLPAIG